MNSIPPSSIALTKPVFAPAALRPVVATSRRDRPIRRHEFSPVKHSTPKTIAAIGLLWLAAAGSTARATTSSPATLVERGRYLVEKVGMCADCHSPRTDKGEFDRARWLMGAPLAFQPTVPMPWSPAAPPIAGLPTMTHPQAVAFLQTGKRPDGSVPRPPMPEFRFNPDDANAVAAYLKSLAK